MSLLINETDNRHEETDIDLDALLRSVASGDQNAFEQLYLRTRSSVYGFALSILKNPHDAEDVLHDCYVAVRGNAGNYRSQGKPMAWLLTITKNLCLQQLRKSEKTSSLTEEEWELYLCETRGLSTEDQSILSACMALLSEQERQIITLHAAAGFKHREIASFLDLPLSTVLSKYHRALKKLRKHLQ